MKSALKRFFTANSNHSHSRDNIVDIKQEEAFFNKQYKKSNDKTNPLDKMVKYQDVLYAIQNYIGQKNALIQALKI